MIIMNEQLTDLFLSSFVFIGINLLNNQPVAVKFEPRKTDAPQLRDEYRAYKILAGSTGFPNAYFFGQEGLHNVLVIDLLGSSLEDLFDACSRQFSVKTVAMLAKEMVSELGWWKTGKNFHGMLTVSLFYIGD